VDLDTLIVATYCLIADALPTVLDGRSLRQRGPRPKVTDAEVLTLEVVGEFLGLDQDVAIYAYFRRHYGTWFPQLAAIHRTTFARQAANLWVLKERLWRAMAAGVSHDPCVAVIDSFPVPVCRFVRAKRCRLFGGAAAFGYDAAARQTFFGFRCHVRLAWPGVIADLVLAPANVSELDVARPLAQETSGYLIGDRYYWSPDLRAALAATGVCLLAPYHSAQRDPDPARSRFLSPIRYRIETIFSQLVGRFHAQPVWARDPWHLATRFRRKILSHTLALRLNARAGNPSRQLARLLA
jgi:Transposase DDE domain